VLGGTQSLHTNSYDEALALPTQASATLALRTQQVLAHETGVPEVVDPVGGSWYVERLTDDLEREAAALIEQVEALGGAARAIERGFFQDAIARSAYDQQGKVERGEQVVVGVNQFDDGSGIPTVVQPDYQSLAEGQRRRVVEARARRDAVAVQRALAALRSASQTADGRLMPGIIDAVRARATVGEISDVFRAVWGVYHPTT
jgi:methylmalonyl-CoA mutase N-terminal domain/subunit